MRRKELEEIAKEDEKIAEFARKKELQMSRRQQIQSERHRYETEDVITTGRQCSCTERLTRADANSKLVSK